ncbi:hypothetical protein CDL15_Pgr027763 [Punica granatum]|nr:hypothetical protein CDL15_Pgr027763 [Punica granatum]
MSLSEIDRSRSYLPVIRGVMDELISGLNHSIRLYNHHLRIADPQAHPLDVTVSGAVFRDVKEVESTFEEWKTLLSLKPRRSSAETDELIFTGENDDKSNDDFSEVGGNDHEEETAERGASPETVDGPEYSSFLFH